MTKRILQALKREAVDRPPFWLMRQAGRYLPEYREIRATAENFLDFCYTPEKALEVTLQPLRRYQMDAAILFSDILVIPDALGQSVAFRQGEGPVLEAITDDVGLDRLSLETFEAALEPVFEAIRRISAVLDDETALIGFAGAPWTVALYMIEGRGGTEGTNIRTWAATRAESFQRLMDILVEATTRYLVRQVSEGAEVLQLFDSWAGLLPEDQFQRWIIEPNRRIVEGVKAIHPDVPIIGFPRNAGVMYRAFADQTGVDGIGIDHTVPVSWAAKELQPICTVQGNLDNHLLLAGGEAMERAVQNILEVLSDGPFIFNLGHGVLPPTSPDHVGRVAEMIRNWNQS
ncbi:MAG: uroporphyrinogen decarboxylase [Rhodospirillaceae bacterium]|jgi:uroporphyrinogen decarboxylase|nr:uroporphyrinogen decarboxylase [Rhodospirillaceae bacterium]